MNYFKKYAIAGSVACALAYDHYCWSVYAYHSWRTSSNLLRYFYASSNL